MKRPFLTLGLSLALLVSGLAATIQAGPPPQVSRPPLPIEGIPEDLPLLESAPASSEPQAEPAAFSSLAGWSKLVFQSYRNGNWEIYRANGDGSAQVRLTNNPASDIHARLNRGCTRIVYASNIDGDYEIITMNLDGSDWAKLTSNNQDDVYPTWSPDGTKIAFQSWRDGQPEIYVMNADGSGQTRLTWEADYDGQPAWSPDGTKIAFIARRGGDNYVWVMNADGSNQHRLFWPSPGGSQNPTWSPDGSQIAFDADGDNDGWRELWLIGAEGQSPTQVYAPSEPQTDAWVRSWSPDGRYLAFTRISFVYRKGYWYWTTAYLDAWDSESGNTIRLSGQGADWRPDWQTADAAAPITRVYALPAYLRDGSAITWGGLDPGGSGIEVYDLQRRVANSDYWHPWQTQTLASMDRFSGLPGETYYFRSRGKDRAWNVEGWPEGDGDAHTTLYSWKVTGQVRDNRDIPIVDVPVTTTPGAMAAFPTDAGGIYSAYVAASAGTYLSAWDKAGYGDLPPARFPSFPDVSTDAFLPPADNVVLDWGFESGDLEPDWWAGGVSAPQVTGHAAHTGNYGARLGCQPFGLLPALNLSNMSGDSWAYKLATDDTGAVHVAWSNAVGEILDIYYSQRQSNGAWSPPLNISDTLDRPVLTDMVVDGEGSVHVVLHAISAGTWEIFYSRRTSDGTWTSPLNISNNPDHSIGGQLAVSSDGIVHAIWQDSVGSPIRGIYHAWRGNDGLWSSPQLISGDLVSAQLQRLGVDGDGIAHAVWSTGWEVRYAGRGSDGTWSVPLKLSNISGSPSSLGLVVDGQRNLHVVWRQTIPYGADIFYARRGSQGTWSASENISNDPKYSDAPHLAVDGGGNAHVVWTYNQDTILYTRRGSNGFWSLPLAISNPSDDADQSQVAVAADGQVHVVWSGRASGGYSDIYYAHRSANGPWHAPRNVSQTSGASENPSGTAGEGGTVHIVWIDPTPGNRDVYYAGPEFATQTGHAAISQAVDVPTSMHSPTLSFLYRLGGASSTNGTWFSANLEDGVEATTLLSTTTNSTAWVHPWFDLSPWAGQTITLTFDLHQTAERLCPGVDLDEVTLGSAHPDLWVSKPQLAVLPGEQVSFSITYGNRGGVAATGVQVRDQLPLELSFVAASPPPSATTPSLVWDVGGLSARSEGLPIVVTATVSPTVSLFTKLTNTVTIETVSPEVEVTNNTSQATVFIGRLIYLPQIQRGEE